MSRTILPRRGWFGMVLVWVLAGWVWLGSGGDGRAAADTGYVRTEDVIYGRAFGTALTMDVFRPERTNGLGVIYVVSGGWFSAKEMINVKALRPFLDRGYVVFAVVHGSNPRYHIPEIFDQMQRAVRYIRFHGARFGIDGSRLGVAGGSAGGHLSLMLATRGGPGKPDAKDPVDRETSAVQAAACFFPPTDFLNYGRAGEEALGEGILKNFRSAFGAVPKEPGARRRFGESISPVYHVKAGVPPIHIVHGDADLLVPIQQAQIFLARVKQVGGEGRLEVKRGALHGWDRWEADVAQFADWMDRHLAPAGASAGDGAGSATATGTGRGKTR